MNPDGQYRVNIIVNGSATPAYSGSYSGGAKLTMGFAAPILNLTAGDYIQVNVYQTSGNTVNTVYDPNYDFGTFIVHYLGA
jgi:hypothetical protein